MDKIIPRFYKNYGKYVNTSRAFPLDVDGLKPVERRVLLSAYQIAREKFVKSARVDGHCLIGNTKIKLANGNVKPIEQLYNENASNFYVFSFDIDNCKPAITKVDKISLTKHTTELIKIVTESGDVICTPDHLWLLKDGNYTEAKDLEVGDLLELVEFGITENNLFKAQWMGLSGYEVVSCSSGCYFSHWLADEYNCKKGIEILTDDKKFQRHHKDFNQLNNNPINIQRLQPEDHMPLHWKIWYSKDGKEILSKNAKELHSKHPQIVEKLMQHNEKMLKQDPEYYSKKARSNWESRSEEDKKEYIERMRQGMLKYYREGGKEKRSERLNNYWNQDTDQVNRHREANRLGGHKMCGNFVNNHRVKILKTMNMLLEQNIVLNEENYNTNRISKRYPLYDKILNYFNSYEEAIEEARKYKNHSVISIEKISYIEPVPVYDLVNAEFYNNFVVQFDDNTGIVSHNCIGHFHPHGTSYGSIVQMVRQGFLEGQGNFGCNLGVEPSPPAAMRYTECKLPTRTLDLAFRLIKHVPWEESDLDKEPKYLPTMFPFCLLGSESTQGIGFGYRTYIPCYKIEDLFARLMWLLGIDKTEPIIKPISDCNILASESALKSLLTTGKATIQVQGRTQINNARLKIAVRSWPPGKRFESILGKLSKELENQDIGFQDLSSGEDGTYIVFEVLKQRSRESIFNKFVPKLQEALKGNISYEMITVDVNDNVGICPVDKLLVLAFENYSVVNSTMLEYEIRKIIDTVNEYKILAKLKPSISKFMTDKVKDVDVVIKKISDDAQVDHAIVQSLFSKYHIRKLLSVNTDTDDLVKKAKELDGNRKNLREFVINQYRSL